MGVAIVVIGLMAVAFVAGMVARDADAEVRVMAMQRECIASLRLEREMHTEALRDALRRSANGVGVKA